MADKINEFKKAFDERFVFKNNRPFEFYQSFQR